MGKQSNIATCHHGGKEVQKFKTVTTSTLNTSHFLSQDC